MSRILPLAGSNMPNSPLRNLVAASNRRNRNLAWPRHGSQIWPRRARTRAIRGCVSTSPSADRKQANERARRSRIVFAAARASRSERWCRCALLKPRRLARRVRRSAPRSLVVAVSLMSFLCITTARRLKGGCTNTGNFAVLDYFGAD